MKIKSEQEITSEAAKYLREQSGLYQRTFWDSVGVNQASGCRFENGQPANGRPIPRSVRILLFLNYVAGITVDVTTPQGVTAIHKLARKQSGAGKASSEVAS